MVWEQALEILLETKLIQLLEIPMSIILWIMLVRVLGVEKRLGRIEEKLGIEKHTFLEGSEKDTKAILEALGERASVKA